MSEIKEKVKPICEMNNKILEWLKPMLENDCIDICSAGQVVDMIKDLAKAEKDCYEAAYYKEIIEAMEDAEEEQEMMEKFGMSDGRMGYNTHHSARTGRFVSGRGRMGFNPIIHQKPYIDAYLGKDEEWEEMPWDHTGRLGYTSIPRMNRSESYNRSGYDGHNSQRHGQAYNEYQNARRHYTETKSEEDKERMKHHAHEHMADTMVTLREIWGSADPDLRKQMKGNLQNLLNEMAV